MDPWGGHPVLMTRPLSPVSEFGATVCPGFVNSPGPVQGARILRGQAGGRRGGGRVRGLGHKGSLDCWLGVHRGSFPGSARVRSGSAVRHLDGLLYRLRGRWRGKGYALAGRRHEQSDQGCVKSKAQTDGERQISSPPLGPRIQELIQILVHPCHPPYPIRFVLQSNIYEL